MHFHKLLKFFNFLKKVCCHFHCDCIESIDQFAENRTLFDVEQKSKKCIPTVACLCLSLLWFTELLVFILFGNILSIILSDNMCALFCFFFFVDSTTYILDCLILSHRTSLQSFSLLLQFAIAYIDVFSNCSFFLSVQSAVLFQRLHYFYVYLLTSLSTAYFFP